MTKDCTERRCTTCKFEWDPYDEPCKTCFVTVCRHWKPKNVKGKTTGKTGSIERARSILDEAILSGETIEIIGDV